MSAPVVALPLDDADLRWQRWQAEGVAHDRKRDNRMKALALVVGIGLGIAVLVQFL